MSKILCIWDGFGLAPAASNNPTSLAKMPNLKRLMNEYPWTTLNADGDSVGQEEGLVGNSEVGHMNLGGLQLVKQLSFQITQSAATGFKYDQQTAPDQLFDPEELLLHKFKISNPLQEFDQLKDLRLLRAFWKDLFDQDWDLSLDSTKGRNPEMRNIIDSFRGSKSVEISELGEQSYSDLILRKILDQMNFMKKFKYEKIENWLIELNLSVEPGYFGLNTYTDLFELAHSSLGELIRLSSNQTVHLVGLFSTGTIHSDMRHWVGAIEATGLAGAEQIVLHIISDGRDSDRQSLVATWEEFTTKYADRLQPFEDRIFLGSLGGRFYAMDRDKNWDRTLFGLSAFVGIDKTLIENSNFSQIYEIDYADLQLVAENVESINQSYSDIKSCLENIANTSYSQAVYDETITPRGYSRALENDTIWLINFRSDRMKQLTKMLTDLNQELDLNLTILANNDYGIGKEILLNQEEVLRYAQDDKSKTGYYPVFKTRAVQNTLSQHIAKSNATQLHIAETEKYAHVTYFFDGGVEQKQEGEEWVVIPSNKVASHAEKPEMKAVEVTDYILEHGLGKFDYIIVNYANPDMVGHTGDIQASIKALEVLDEQLGRLLEVVEKEGHSMVITADHGNVEKVGEYEHEGKNLTDTEHNADPVPCIIVNQLAKLDLAQYLEKVTATIQTNHLNLQPEVIKSALNESKTHKINLSDSNWLITEQITQPKLPLWAAGLLTLN